MMENLRDQINRIELEREEGLKKVEELRFNADEEVRKNRELEAAKYEELKQIIAGEQYFRLAHFDKLNIPYDILIHLSAKNTGKTTELYRLIKGCIERGEKFIYGRVTQSELATEKDKFRTDEMSPVIILGSAGSYYFYEKSKIEDYQLTHPNKMSLRIGDLEKAGIDYVGKAIAFMNSNQLGAGNYKGFTTMFFDEIVSYSPKNYVSKMILSNGSAAVSTILRNKEKLTIIMMGNLRPNMTSVPILDFYEIDIADNLRIVKRSMGDGEPCTILYINSGSLYGNSLKNQASVAHHGSLEDRIFLEHNKLINTSTKVLTHEIVDKMQHITAFAVSYKQEQYVLELKRAACPKDTDSNIEEYDYYYALKVHPLKLTTAVKGIIGTCDWSISHQYSKIRNTKGNYSRFMLIIKFFMSHKLYYDSAQSLQLGSEIIYYFKDKVLKDE